MEERRWPHSCPEVTKYSSAIFVALITAARSVLGSRAGSRWSCFPLDLGGQFSSRVFLWRDPRWRRHEMLSTSTPVGGVS